MYTPIKPPKYKDFQDFITFLHDPKWRYKLNAEFESASFIGRSAVPWWVKINIQLNFLNFTFSSYLS